MMTSSPKPACTMSLGQPKKTVSQENFDDIVTENIVEFGMSPEDAIVDADEQLKAQNVLTANFIKDPEAFVEGRANHKCIALLKKMQQFCLNDSELPAEWRDVVNLLQNELNKGIGHQLLVTEKYGYSIFVDTLESLVNSSAHGEEPIILVVHLLIDLTKRNPDCALAERNGYLINLLKDCDTNLSLVMLKLFLNISKMHERNRQSLIGLGVLSILVDKLLKFQADEGIVIMCCRVLQAYLVDDDLRVEFSTVHDNAVAVVQCPNILSTLVELCSKDSTSDELLQVLLLSLSRLIVRSDFCVQMEELGILPILDCIIHNKMTDKKIVSHSLTLLKSICGNDDVRRAAVSIGAITTTVTVMEQHPASVVVQQACLSLLAVIALRCPDNCDKIMLSGGADLVVAAMKMHTGNLGIQKMACLTIRNLVSRSPQHKASFHVLGIEELLQPCLSLCHDEAKAALRDLDCDIQFICQWMGVNGEIQR